jgi:serine/threonine-protein kinase
MAVLAALGVLAVVALGIGLALANRDKRSDEHATDVAMPNLIGKSEEEARADLAEQNFSSVTVGTPVEKDDCDKPDGGEPEPAQGTNVRIDQPSASRCARAPTR